MVELVKAIPTSLTRAPAGPHALASAEVRWIAENTDVETSTSAPPKPVTANRVYNSIPGSAATIGGNKGNV